MVNTRNIASLWLNVKVMIRCWGLCESYDTMVNMQRAWVTSGSIFGRVRKYVFEMRPVYKDIINAVMIYVLSILRWTWCEFPWGPGTVLSRGSDRRFHKILETSRHVAKEGWRTYPTG